MDTQLIILIVVVVLVLMGAVAFFVRRSEAKNELDQSAEWLDQLGQQQGGAQPPKPAGLNPQVMNQITAAIHAGNKLEAIKLFRQATGVGLKEAKDVIDGMEKNVGQTAVPNDPDQAMAWLESRAATERPSTASISREAMLQVFGYLRAGNKIEAIKLYREQTGLGLKEAKDAVDGLEKAVNAGLPIDSMLTAPVPTNPAQGNWMQEVMDEIRAGRKINAIKIYRENSGLGLKESKDAVDALEKNL